jgi:hypothetical protein
MGGDLDTSDSISQRIADCGLPPRVTRSPAGAGTGSHDAAAGARSRIARFQTYKRGGPLSTSRRSCEIRRGDADSRTPGMNEANCRAAGNWYGHAPVLLTLGHRGSDTLHSHLNRARSRPARMVMELQAGENRKFPDRGRGKYERAALRPMAPTHEPAAECSDIRARVIWYPLQVLRRSDHRPPHMCNRTVVKT